MQENFEIEAEIRTDLGKGASRRLRHTNKLPAVIYGGGKDAVSLTLTHNVMQLHLEHEAFYSHILSVKVDGKAEMAILRDVQRHPSKPTIMHMDFLRVNETETLRMSVPLHFENEDTCVGVKTGGGQINHIVSQVEVSCLAKDLPEFITVDVGNVELGASLHMSEITLPEGVTLVELEHDHDLAVVNVVKPRGIAEEDETPAAEEGGEEAAPEATED